MSKYILIIASLLLHIHAIAQTETKPISTKATFGRYGANCSSGRGVCSFSALGEETRIATAARSWKVGVNTLVVEFQTALLSIDDQIRIAGKAFNDVRENETSTFIQQERLILSKETLANLDMDPLCDLIDAGNYDMHIGKERAEIIIKLKPSE
ncbi:MAG TPA: hypothetical protein VGB43_08400 [Flavobacterium sp.]|jgi:hypothetical protein